MRKLLAMMLCGGFVAVCSGCMGTVAKRALSEVAGASSKGHAVPGLATSKITACQGVKIGAPRTDLGSLVSSRFSGALPGALRKALTQGKEPMFSGGSPTLEIDPQITWYSEAGGLGGLLGSDSYAVVLFWLSCDGSPLGKVEVVAKTGAARTSDEDMADAVAKGLANFLKDQGKRSQRDKSRD